jgi:hypothetical protein
MVYSDNSAVVSFPTPASFFDSFEMEKVLNQGKLSSNPSLALAPQLNNCAPIDPVNKSFWLLGTAIPAGTLDPTRREPALLRLAQTPLDPSATNALAVSAAWKQLDMVTTNSIYATMIGQSIAGGGEFQLSIICPATDKVSLSVASLRPLRSDTDTLNYCRVRCGSILKSIRFRNLKLFEKPLNCIPRSLSLISTLFLLFLSHGKAYLASW